MHIVLFHRKEYLYFTVNYTFFQKHCVFFTHSMALASCAFLFLPGQQCTTLAGSFCLTIRSVFMFCTVRGCYRHAAKRAYSSSENDDIDAGQSAAASDWDQYSRSVLSCTSSAARCLVGFINGIEEL
jgi:hypothetical protein